MKLDELIKFTTDEVMLQLEREGKIRVKDLNSFISFQPVNCNKTYNAALQAKGKHLDPIFDNGTYGKRVTVTCKVFEGKKYWDYPYIIVTEMQMK